LIKKPKKLDIPCGPDNITLYVEEKLPSSVIYGADLAEEMLNFAAVTCPNTKYFKLDMNNIDKLKERFDCIICGFGFPYLKGYGNIDSAIVQYKTK
jgi:trans-aconitate methyltransferase